MLFQLLPLGGKGECLRKGTMNCDVMPLHCLGNDSPVHFAMSLQITWAYLISIETLLSFYVLFVIVVHSYFRDSTEAKESV